MLGNRREGRWHPNKSESVGPVTLLTPSLMQRYGNCRFTIHGFSQRCTGKIVGPLRSSANYLQKRKRRTLWVQVFMNYDVLKRSTLSTLTHIVIQVASTSSLVVLFNRVLLISSSLHIRPTTFHVSVCPPKNRCRVGRGPRHKYVISCSSFSPQSRSDEQPDSQHQVNHHRKNATRVIALGRSSPYTPRSHRKTTTRRSNAVKKMRMGFWFS